MTWRDKHPEVEAEISTYFRNKCLKYDLGQISEKEFEVGMGNIGKVSFSDLQKELTGYYIINQKLINYIRQLKKDTQVFILSNAGKTLVHKTLKKNNLTELFDQILVSANIGLVKPSPEIFNYVLDTYSLNKKDVTFVDDTLENVEAAQALGIQSIHFTNFENFKKEFEHLEH